MSNVYRILLQLACCLAGWGMTTGLRSGRPPETDTAMPGAADSNAVAVNSASPSTKISLRRPNGTDGKLLIERLLKEAPDDLRSKWRHHGSGVVTVQAIFKDLVESQNLSDAGMEAAESHRDVTIRWNVNGLLSNCDGIDLNYAFRHGRVDAQEILDRLARRLPEDAARPAFRAALYKSLALQNLRGAESLLNPYSPDEIIHLKYEAIEESDSIFRGVSFRSEALLALIESIPHASDTAMATRRQAAWLKVSSSCFSSFGSYYVDWVEQQPAGWDRDQAAAALLTQMIDCDPADYNRALALIANPQIRDDFTPR